MPDIQPQIDETPFDNLSKISTFNPLVATINSGTADLILPPAFLKFPHVFLGFTFVTVDGKTPVTPGAGTITFKAKTEVNPENAEALKVGTDGDSIDIDATATPINLSFDGPATSIEVTGSGITVAISVRVRVKGFAR